MEGEGRRRLMKGREKNLKGRESNSIGGDTDIEAGSIEGGITTSGKRDEHSTCGTF